MPQCHSEMRAQCPVLAPGDLPVPEENAGEAISELQFYILFAFFCYSFLIEEDVLFNIWVVFFLSAQVFFNFFRFTYHLIKNIFPSLASVQM